MTHPLVEAYAAPERCSCDCFAKLSLAQRTAGVKAMMRFDDIVRGWGVTPLYEPDAPHLFQEAKMAADDTYRSVAVRDHECLYGRLVGFAVHELIHALLGEPDEANWGMPWGLPYGVPTELPPGEEAELLVPFNLAEACAFVGVPRLAEAMFGIRWRLRTARDVGTYGFVGGKAVCPVPPGYRPVPHVDRQIETARYYGMARQLEARADAFMTPEVIAEWCQELVEVEARGAAARAEPWPDPETLAAHVPTR